MQRRATPATRRASCLRRRRTCSGGRPGIGNEPQLPSVGHCSAALLPLRLGDEAAVGVAGMVVGAAGVVHFGGGDEPLLLLPAAVHALEAPLRAAAGGADRLAA